MTQYALDANWRKWRPSSIVPAEIRFHQGKKLRDLIASDGRRRPDRFADHENPLACVATDIDTGEEVVIDSGPWRSAAGQHLHSGIFSVVRHEAGTGGRRACPLRCRWKWSADGGGLHHRRERLPGMNGRMGKAACGGVKAHREPNIIQVMMQCIYVTTCAVAHNNSEADILIEPELGRLGTGDSISREIIAAAARRPESDAGDQIVDGKLQARTNDAGIEFHVDDYGLSLDTVSFMGNSRAIHAVTVDVHSVGFRRLSAQRSNLCASPIWKYIFRTRFCRIHHRLSGNAPRTPRAAPWAHSPGRSTAKSGRWSPHPPGTFPHAGRQETLKDCLPRPANQQYTDRLVIYLNIYYPP
jgi:hypothetical protein